MEIEYITTEDSGLLPKGTVFKPIGENIANDWSNDYTILNTDKWKVPMQRPPLCINTNPCKVCPVDSNYPVNLRAWDESRVISKNND